MLLVAKPTKICKQLQTARVPCGATVIARHMTDKAKPEGDHWVVKAILSTTSEGRKVLSDIKKVEKEREAKQEEEMDRTNKVINPSTSNPNDMDLLGVKDNLINGYKGSFFHVGKVALYGSIFVFEDVFFLWRISHVKELTVSSLEILRTYNPLPTMVILGTGKVLRHPPQHVIQHYAKLGITIEALKTVDAISTFNFLLQEGRSVAGAFIAIDPIPESLDPNQQQSEGQKE
eukprot:TRINITY_DN11879_c0_g1_i1.p1 TRINITY_DN11879_c0_g1~~TRINITY_DN11879_c0_g1_i1.p1  ORF type:complete len:232 (-),score=57.34 TRINITY_DN11879_c0_g1_i1:11-706(-)